MIENKKNKQDFVFLNPFFLKASIFFAVLLISLFFSSKAMAATFTNDTFTDTASTSLAAHIGETGAVWTATQGTALIDSSGRLRGNDAGIARYYSSGVPSSADYDVDWDVHVNTNPVGTFIVSALARADTVQRYNYQVSYNYLGAGLWSLYRYDAGGATLLGSWQGVAVPGATYHGKITLRGADIKVYIDSTERISVTDASPITSVGRAGVEFYNTVADGSGIVLDNFSATDATATIYTFTGPTTGSLNNTSTFFTIAPNGTYVGTITPTSTGQGVFYPASLTWADGDGAKTFTYKPTNATGSPHVISTLSSPALTNPASISLIINTAFVKDTFTDSAGISLESHVGELNARWAKHPTPSGNAAVIDSNGRPRSTNVAGARYYANGIPFSANYNLDWDVHVYSVPGVQTIVGAVGRMDTSANIFYEVWYDQTGLWRLWHYTGGSADLLGSWQGTIATGATHHAKLSLNGSDLVLYVNNVARISVTDASPIIDIGRVGFLEYPSTVDGEGIVIDNFIASELVVAATSTSFAGPTSGIINSTSTVFTVSPNGSYSGTITPTSTGAGFFTPSSLTWSGDTQPKTFTYTPTSVNGSPHVISLDSLPVLIPPATISYDVYTIFSKDTFTDTAGTSLASHIGEGATWTATEGSVAIDSSGKAMGTFAGTSRYYADAIPTTADYDLEWDVHINSIPGITFVVSGMARASTTAREQYDVTYNYGSGGNWTLYRYNVTSADLLGSWQGAIVPGETYHVKFTLRGAVLKVYIDGVERISATDSAPLTKPGRVGIEPYATVADGSGIVIDNFVASENASTATLLTLTGPANGFVNNASANFTVAPNGAYTGTITPTSTGAGTFSPTSLTWSGDMTPKIFKYTPSSVSGSPHQISITSLPARINPAAVSYTVIPTQATILVNNPSLYWSRDNVYVDGASSAFMLTTGSYLKTNFTGTSITVNFDVSGFVGASVPAANYPIIRYQVDGGAWISWQLSSANPSLSVFNLVAGTHLFRLEFVSSNIFPTPPDRWVTPVNVVKISNLSIDQGSAVSLPTILSKRLRVDGDSITEGGRAVDSGNLATSHSGVLAYPYLLAGLIGTELSQLGYGGQGWTTTGTAGIPTYPNAVDYYHSGVSRLVGGVLPEAPDYWLIVQGTNDGSTALGTLVQDRIVQARIEAGSVCEIFVVVPFGGYERANITSNFNAYVAAHPTDHNVHLIDLGAIAFSTTDGLHPDAAGHVVLANAVYEAMNNVLPVFSASPSSIVQNTIGNQITISGTSTSWTAGVPGTPIFTLTGGTGASIASQTVISSTSTVLTINTGSAVGTLVVTDPSNNATTNITVVADVVVPIVNTFVIPATANSLTVSITSFTASDNAVVTGYLINESSVAPTIGASGWLSSPATAYTFSSSGNKTLYAWAKDAVGNISASRNDSVVINYNSGGGVIYPAPKANNQASTSVVVLPVIEAPVVSTSTILTIKPISLVGVNSETVNGVSADEAKGMFVEAKYAPLSEAEKKIYLKIISLSTVTISEENKIVIANFINQGTPTTIAIGAGERGGVISSFASAFGYLPKTEADWQDVIKIANGRWPKGENTEALRLAKLSFKTIYQRNANLKNANDNAAITVMAYGLRPAQRNLASEKAAIKSYRAIFKRDPLTARAWDAVRAIAYSGAKR